MSIQDIELTLNLKPRASILREFLKKPLTIDFFGPWGMHGNHPTNKKAYLIVPGGSTRVEHQYGCVGCYHFEASDKTVYPIRNKLGELLEGWTRCRPDQECLKALFGSHFHSVDEGLIWLSDGSTILTWNCD